MQYENARLDGRLAEFLEGLRQTIGAADEVTVTAGEWLAHDGFRAAVASLLPRNPR